MDIIVPNYYREYGLYTNKSKMFPNILDGLIPVQRRTLLGAYSIAKSKFVKTVKVIGEVIGKWHPHAEQVGTIEWAVQSGFLEGDGWWGTKLGSSPSSCAAPRYTSVKLNSNTYDIALKYVDYVKWEEDELDPEPIAFPTMLPFALLSKYTQSFIGFGRRTVIPIYKKEDLIVRLFDKSKIIKPNIIGATCISSDNEIKDILEKSEELTRYKLSFQIKYIIDEKNTAIYVISCPEVSFTSVLKKFGKLWDNGDIGYLEIPVPNNVAKQLKCSEDEKVCFKFTPAKARNISKIFDSMKKALKKLKFDIHFEIITYDPEIDNIRQISVDKFLESCYNYYTETFKTYLNSEIDRINKLIEEYEIIKAIQPHLGKYLNSRAFFETKIKELSKLTGIPCDKINHVVSKYRIKTILTLVTDTKEYQNELQEIKKKLKNIQSEIIQEYQRII